jgi:hypothetical protein
MLSFNTTLPRACCVQALVLRGFCFAMSAAKSYDEVLFFVGYLCTMGMECRAIIRTIQKHHGNQLSELEVVQYINEFQKRYHPKLRYWLSRWTLTTSHTFYNALTKDIERDDVRVRVLGGRDLSPGVSYRANQKFCDYMAHLRRQMAQGTAIHTGEVESALGGKFYRRFKPRMAEHLVWQWADFGPEAYTLSDLISWTQERYGDSGSKTLTDFRQFLLSTITPGHPDLRNPRLPLFEHVVCYLRWLTKFNPIDEMNPS